MITLIFPIHLFELKYAKILNKQTVIYIIEEPTYFTKFNFHKMKLILHRASMKQYQYYLVSNGYVVKYIEFDKVTAFYKKIKDMKVNCYDVYDHDLTKKLTKLFGQHIEFHDSPMFIETTKELDEYVNNNTSYNLNKYTYHHDSSFYRWQRRRLNLLMDKNGQDPLFGKWSYDTENRKPFPKDYKEELLISVNNDFIKEAKNYINKNFPNNFGNTDNFIYPIDHNSAKLWLKSFIKDKLLNFGPIQDAVSKTIIVGNHSLLSPLLNIGLLVPEYVIKQVRKLTITKENIKSIEAFIRQIIGWRSYVHLLYNLHGNEMKEMNKLNHTNKLSQNWYTAKTGIVPIDCLIEKVKDYAYLHHIERLMYIGNFMLLTKIDPKDVYKWFMEVSIDSYDWVMVANVFGMSQYALDNIRMMAKPYFSSCNYLMKMSDFEKGEWCNIWNALFWKFVDENKEILKKNYITATFVSKLNKMENKSKIIKFANEIIKKY